MIVAKITKKNDEYYTPEYGVTPIVKYLKHKSTILCPFDTEESMFVKVFNENGFNVIYTHIKYNQDFFDVCKQIKYGEIEKQKIDYIISNPPYSIKQQVFETLFDIDIPFAMLVSSPGLFEGQRFNLFANNKFELLMFNKRISFINKDNNETVNPPFSTWYVCHNILQRQIVFDTIEK